MSVAGLSLGFLLWVPLREGVLHCCMELVPEWCPAGGALSPGSRMESSGQEGLRSWGPVWLGCLGHSCTAFPHSRSYWALLALL